MTLVQGRMNLMVSNYYRAFLIRDTRSNVLKQSTFFRSMGSFRRVHHFVAPDAAFAAIRGPSFRTHGTVDAGSLPGAAFGMTEWREPRTPPSMGSFRRIRSRAPRSMGSFRLPSPTFLRPPKRASRRQAELAETDRRLPLHGVECRKNGKSPNPDPHRHPGQAAQPRRSGVHLAGRKMDPSSRLWLGRDDELGVPLHGVVCPEKRMAPKCLQQI